MRRFIPCALALTSLGCPTAEPAPPALDAGGFTDASPDSSDAHLLADASDVDPDASTPSTHPLDEWSWPEPSYPTREGDFWARHARVGGHVSAWVGRAHGLEREPLDQFAIGSRGALGVGSGHIAALVGIHDPRNTLHSIVGPTYQRQGGYFGDVSMYLEVAGERVVFEQEWIAQSFGAPAVLWRGDRGDLTLEVVAFAPRTTQAARTCILQIARVANRSATSTSPELAVALRGHNTARADAPAEVLHWRTSARSLTTRRVDGDALRGEDGGLRAALGALEPGAERVLSWSHCALEGDGVAAPLELDAESVLESEADEWATWTGGLVEVDVPEQAVADLLEQAAVTLRVQLGARGGLTQLHRYSGAWMRDTIGAALGLVALGSREDARRAVDYVWGSMLTTGDFANSWGADSEVDPDGPQPDWATLGPLPERVRAESPSYFVWMHELLWRAGDPDELLTSRRGALTRALDAQAFDPDTGLLPFSGDETFRVGMNVALGYELEHPHQETSFSLNSSALWVGAARRLSRAWEDLGDQDEAARLRARADAALADAVAGFGLGDGCHGAVRERGADTPTAPYEDASLKLVWAGALEPTGDLARSQLDCLEDTLGSEPGVLQSTPHPRFRTLVRIFGGGIYTGMLPGYTLSVLTRVGRPEAERALATLGRTADEVGAFQEYHRDSDHSGVTLLYDRGGQGINQTPKFRSWEAGINAAAILEYLTGWSADAPAGRVDLAPNLPGGWPEATYRGLRAGDDRFDLEVERGEDGALLTRVRAHPENVSTWTLSIGRLGMTSDEELAAGEVAEWAEGR